VPLLQVRASEVRGWTQVTATGQLDVATAPELRQVLVRSQYAGATRVLLDVAGIEFVDSMGLGVLVGAHKRARTHGGEFVLCAPSERFRQLLSLTGLDAVLSVVDDADEAVGRAD
jgi:anti-sigma B factor antagonist